MKIWGLSIPFTKAAPVGLSPVPSRGSSFWGFIQESFAGAWQSNVTLESRENMLRFGAVFACVTLIAGDISKLRIKLVEFTSDLIWREVFGDSPFWTVLRKPNRYQTRIQFLEQWIICKLLHGNVYVLKERDQRGIVVALYILDPQLVTPLISPDGSVFYRLGKDLLAGVEGLVDSEAVPASEIIHDRMNCLWHPLVGVSPIYACGSSATQGIKIQANSAKFFENMSRPSGMLTAPGSISDETAARLKAAWEQNFSGVNIGRLAVLGDGLKYEAMTIPANDAQLIEQQRWTVEDIGRCFHVPLYKIQSGQNPTFNNVAAMNQEYYTQTLQVLIEAIELLLDEGLNLVNVTGKTLGTELDLTGLLRMDPLGRADANQKAIAGGYLAPNEARLAENLPPVDGGDTPYLQMQNWSLAMLDKRPAPTDTPALPAPEDAAKKLTDMLIAKFVKAAHA